MGERIASLALTACWGARAIWIHVDPDHDSRLRAEHDYLAEERGSFARGLAYGLLITAVMIGIIVGIWIWVF